MAYNKKSRVNHARKAINVISNTLSLRSRYRFENICSFPSIRTLKSKIELFESKALAEARHNPS
mgnify:CR=1 FL=1